MATRKVVVIGGGPAGLLAARLLALTGFQVTVFERLDPRATYGFGVALANGVLDRLRDRDAEAADRIEALSFPLRRWTMKRDDESATIEDSGGAGVSRYRLLRTLQSLATEAGASIEAGVGVKAEDVADRGDVVILADGVGSQGRDSLADRLGARVESVPIPYIWCGAQLEMDSMTLVLRRSDHGIFSGHVMPYGDGLCTFQVDTVPEVLEAAGLREGAGEGESGSDESSLSFLTDHFEPILKGQALLGNRSRWSRFRLVTNERWSTGKFVLLGDAAHTAHYTVGSGTRMAMEDAIVLADALEGEGALDRAFESYEAERRPAVEHLQWRAQRSQTWWRTLAHRYHLPLPVLLFSYFTRTGSVGLERLSRSNPDIALAAVERRRQKAGSSPDRAASAPSGMGALQSEILVGRLLEQKDLVGRSLPPGMDRMATMETDGIAPWSNASSSFVRDFGAGKDTGFLLRGAGDSRAVLDRFDIAEEMRETAQATVAVAVPESSLGEAATAIAADRIDYVVLQR